MLRRFEVAPILQMDAAAQCANGTLSCAECLPKQTTGDGQWMEYRNLYPFYTLS